MYFDAEIELVGINKNQIRSGFNDKFHLVKFALISQDINSLEVDIWVHPNYPESEIVKVARTFLHRRLLDFVEIAAPEIYSPEEIDALWQSVKPDKIA